MEVISERFYNASHSWIYEKTLSSNRHKLKVVIRRNAYDDQSYARVSRWGGSKWEVVVNMPISECKCRTTSYVLSEARANKQLFRSDAERILVEAMKVIES
jgi:hypothetical protein